MDNQSAMVNPPPIAKTALWLAEPALEACVVGSAALAEACAQAGLTAPPRPADLDLAWRLSPEEGARLCHAHGLDAKATPGALTRGTLGVHIDGTRVEITTFRGGGADFHARVAADAALRDMTIGALYWSLADGAILDPMNGLADWRGRCIRACGSAADRIREHPIRLLRYVRRATQLGFWLDNATRRGLRSAAAHTANIVPEALAEELRRVLVTCSSPGVFFQVCAEETTLSEFLPELAPQFDGRPAGRIRWHPEISQALHMVLALRTAASLATERGLRESERIRLVLGVLLHDLGKGTTPEAELPSHPGHEAAGVQCIESLFRRLPALASKRTKTFCKNMARDHLLLAGLRRLKPGTLVDLWDRDLAPMRDDHRLLAAAVRCDREGRLQPSLLGLPVADTPAETPDALEQRIANDLEELDSVLRGVSGTASAELFPGDPTRLRCHLRAARCQALAAAGYCERRR